MNLLDLPAVRHPPLPDRLAGHQEGEQRVAVGQRQESGAVDGVLGAERAPARQVVRGGRQGPRLPLEGRQLRREAPVPLLHAEAELPAGCVHGALEK